MEIDWSKAPNNCTGALVALPHNVHFPKITYALHISKEGTQMTGESCDGRMLCAYSDLWEYVERPKTWTGEGLPPVGTVCLLSGKTPTLDPIHPQWAGSEVKIYAHFKTDQGRELAAYVSEDHMKGGVGVEKLFIPIRTAEQIAAEERKTAVMEIVDLIGWDRSSPEARYAAERVYDGGYRKQAQS